MGHPVVTIERVDAKKIRITQQQFLFDSTLIPIQPSPYKLKNEY
jgi:hypothetical protein